MSQVMAAGGPCCIRFLGDHAMAIDSFELVILRRCIWTLYLLCQAISLVIEQSKCPMLSFVSWSCRLCFCRACVGRVVEGAVDMSDVSS